MYCELCVLRGRQFQFLEDLNKIGWDRRLEEHFFPGDWVRDIEFPSVQHLPLRIRAWRVLGSSAVKGVSEDWVSDMGHVNADLVGSSREDFDFDQRATVSLSDDFVEGGGGFAFWHDGHSLPVGGMPSDGCFDGSHFLFRGADDDCQIDFVQVMLLECFFERCPDIEILGNDERAGRFLVESVNDAWSLVGIKHFLEDFLVMEQEAMDEGTGVVAFCGVDDHARRFVDDDDVFVLKKDVEWDVLGGDGFDLVFWRPVDFDYISRESLRRLLDDASVQVDAPEFDAALEEGS